MTQASITPKIVFIGTQIKAVISVSRIAAKISRFLNMRKYTLAPACNAWEKIVTKGIKIKIDKNASAIMSKTGFIHGGS
jgi:hypothetical protein